nr:DUF2971 domain-containing protein [uncultured Hyphomonas sp.]
MLNFEQLQALNYAAGAADYSTKIIHYTSEDNLYRILESNELWFGRIDQMNDASEYSHYFNVVEEVITKLVPGVPAPMLNQLFQQVDQQVRGAAFISSWCEYSDEFSEGSLQMWRAYGNSGAGIAAVVDSSSLQPSALTPNKFGFFVNSSKVQYVRTDEVESIANELLDKIRSSGVLSSIPNSEVILGPMLVAKAPTSKHHAFREEKEVRFLALPNFARQAGRFFPENCMREVKHDNKTRAFFALPLINWEQFEFDLRLSTVLKKVLIGPLRNPEERKQRVRRKLDSVGLQHVETEIVDIPLRE